MMRFPKYVDDCLGQFPLEKIIIYIEKFLIEKHIKYDVVRHHDIIVKIQDENIDGIFEGIINSNPGLSSDENVLIRHLTIHELETNTMISFAYYDDLFSHFPRNTEFYQFPINSESSNSESSNEDEEKKEK